MKKIKNAVLALALAAFLAGCDESGIEGMENNKSYYDGNNHFDYCLVEAGGHTIEGHVKNWSEYDNGENGSDAIQAVLDKYRIDGGAWVDGTIAVYSHLSTLVLVTDPAWSDDFAK